MPVKTIPDFPEHIKEHFWNRVNKNGPIPTAQPHLGQCWLWVSADKRRKYGNMKWQRINFQTHRVSWKLHYGDTPIDLLVCHKCDVGFCVRPDHLFLGTTEDNAHDAMKKGRLASGDRHGSKLHPESVPRGERHGSRTHPEKVPRGDRSGPYLHPERMARGDKNGRHTHPERTARGEGSGQSVFTALQVLEIRSLTPSLSYAQLATRFGTSRSAIAHVVKRRNWKHI